MNNSMKTFLTCLLLSAMVFAGLFQPVVNAAAADKINSVKSAFSAKVDSSLQLASEALDRSIIKLLQQLDKSDVLSVKVHSHFYDAKIRRYFISISGNGTFKGKLPTRLKQREILVSCDKEVAFDFYFSEIKYEGLSISCKYEGTVVFNMDRIAYRLMQKIPHLAASGALAPAADMLKDLLSELNIGILSVAISDSIKSFSTVAIAKTGAELLSAAGNNKNLKLVIKDAMKDGSILSFIGLSILKCSMQSLVSVAGASLGSTVGTVLAPGIGSVIGGYIGSEILSHAAATVFYHATVKMPVRRDLKKMVIDYQILKENSRDTLAKISYQEAISRTQKKLFDELNSGKFKLFQVVIEEIDKFRPTERPAFVPLLQRIQEKLIFKVINDQDWYYAKFYHQLKLKVEKWGLQQLVPFSGDAGISRPAN